MERNVHVVDELKAEKEHIKLCLSGYLEITLMTLDHDMRRNTENL